MAARLWTEWATLSHGWPTIRCMEDSLPPPAPITMSRAATDVHRLPPEPGRPCLRGTELRYLLILILHRERRALTVGELVAAVARAGFDVLGRPGKTVSDALRWEVDRGRVRKPARGRYAIGTVCHQTRWRMRRRIARRRALGGTSHVPGSRHPRPAPDAAAALSPPAA